MTVDSKGYGRRASFPYGSKQGVRNRQSMNYYRCFQNYYHGHNYLKPNPRYYVNVKANVHHWQLRDLIQVNKKTGQLYYTERNTVKSLDVRSERSEEARSKVHEQLEYFPKCFLHGGEGEIVTGGLVSTTARSCMQNMETLTVNDKKSSKNKTFQSPKGLFSFHNPNIGASKMMRLGEVINNGVTLYPGVGSGYLSYVCNNDSNLYLVDIHNEDRIDLSGNVVCEANTSLNNVCRPPGNDKLLTVTGDSSSIFLVDPVACEVSNTIKTNHDSGFGVSYHPSGTLFATAFQDGTCSIYDIRNLSSPLSEIKSTRPGNQAGAFRCCKFSDWCSSDMLVILEHAGRVHLVDLRKLNSESDDDHQVIVFPFALNQFVDFNTKSSSGKTGNQEKEGDSGDNEQKENYLASGKHRRVNIYGKNSELGKTGSLNDTTDVSDQFMTPLVYDYDYLTNVNPTLFKNRFFQPRRSSTCEDGLTAIGTQTLGRPALSNSSWDYSFRNLTSGGALTSPAASPTQTRRFSISTVPNLMNQDSDIIQFGQQGIDCSSEPSSPVDVNGSTFCDDFYQLEYQKSVNHINGELELCGLDWYDNRLFVGSENAGIMNWEVNLLGRNSFGSYSYV